MQLRAYVRPAGRPYLALAGLTCLALTACGGSDDDGGSGGSSSGPTIPTASCGGVRVFNLNNDGATSTANTYSLNGQIDGDDFAGSCGGEDAGFDAVIQFQAPSAGGWEFSTQNTGYNHILFAMGDCNDGFSERSCNGPTQTGARLVLTLEQDERLFLILDATNTTEVRDFTINAALSNAVGPTLDSVEAFFNARSYGLGIRAAGSDPDNDIASYRLTLLDSNLASLGGDPIEEALSASEVAQLQYSGDGFVFQFAAGLNDQLPPIGGVRLAFIDQAGLESQEIEVAISEPAAAERGGQCDEIFVTCGEVDFCDQGTCIEANPPTITRIEAYANPAAGSLGILIEGSDPEGNPAFIDVLPVEGNRNVSILENGGPARYGFEYIDVADDNTFTGWVSFNGVFSSVCLGPALDLRDSCIDGGGNQNDCVEQAQANFESCNFDKVADITAMNLSVGDTTLKIAEEQRVDIMAVSMAAEGEQCDLQSGIWDCGEGNACHLQATPEEPSACQALTPACPEAWNVVNMNDNAAGTSFVYDGDSSGETNKARNGTCGGGGPQIVHEFTPETDGDYVAFTRATAQNSDTLLFARSHCALPQTDYELACNDDIDGQNGNFLSSVVLEDLTAGNPVYLFVDGYQGSFAAPYTLTVQAR